MRFRNAPTLICYFNNLTGSPSNPCTLEKFANADEAENPLTFIYYKPNLLYAQRSWKIRPEIQFNAKRMLYIIENFWSCWKTS
jgi:hypothetical protein